MVPRLSEAVSKHPERNPGERKGPEEGAEGAEVRIWGFPPSSVTSLGLCALCVLWGQLRDGRGMAEDKSASISGCLGPRIVAHEQRKEAFDDPSLHFYPAEPVPGGETPYSGRRPLGGRSACRGERRCLPRRLRPS